MSEGQTTPETSAAAPALRAGRFDLLALLLYALSSALVMAHQVGGYGALASEGALFAELHGESLERPWQLGELLPYRYRPVFRALVMSAYRAGEPSPERFFQLFVLASGLSLFLAAGAFHWLLRALAFTRRQALGGVALFFLSFPVVFSHDMPIHTREDFLGYAWIALTLLALARERVWLACLLACVGGSIRETCLLGLLPYLLIARPEHSAWLSRFGGSAASGVGGGQGALSERARHWLHVGLVFAIPGATWLAVRAWRSTGESYDYWGVSTSPTFQFPLEALLYAFAAFGALWVAAALRLAQRQPPRHPLLAPRVVALAVVASLGTGWTLGMVREARITFILFPFVIPLALEALCQPRVRAGLRERKAWLAAAAVLLAYGLWLHWLRQDPTRVDGVQRYLAESFNVGVAPLRQLPDGRVVEWAFASPLNGLHVALNLAASLWLLVVWRVGPSAGDPDRTPG
ncbi:MAG TPA: hypothetical protein DEA08_39140 [Planctomycetes bacterium]|nr:hypothetical protein [Planctomycetota bacterium]